MLPASLAFAWILWRQHRWGIAAVLGYLAFAAAVSALLPDLSAGNLFGFLMLPLYFLPVYLLVVFTYGLEITELSMRESCFPARLFRLPLPTGTVVWWTLLYGAMAVVLLWLVIAYFVLRPWVEPWGGSVPLWWPALLLAAALAWIQALLWSPFGLPWFRVILLAALIPGLITLAAFASTLDRSENLLTGLFAGAMLIGWMTGYLGVRQARRGDVPDWDWMLWPIRQFTRRLPQRRVPFTSAARAQVWLEWWQTGKTFPIVIASALPVILSMLLLSVIDQEVILVAILWTMLAPVFFGGIALFDRRRGMMPFIAALPMTTADLVGATLKASAWSTLAAWGVLAVMLPLAIVLTGNLDDLLNLWQQPVRADIHWYQLVPGVMLLVVWTWKRKVDRLCLRLTGRRWIEASLGCLCILGYPGLLSITMGILDNRMLPFGMARTLLPWLIAFVLLCRLSATAWALQRVLQQRLLAWRTVAFWVAGWLLLASGLFAALMWALPPGEIPTHYLAFAVLFAMPMARLAATPLALAWNRHR